jgi:hypothetical protein
MFSIRVLEEKERQGEKGRGAGHEEKLNKFETQMTRTVAQIFTCHMLGFWNSN